MSQASQIQKTAPVSSMKMLRAMVGIGILCALMIVLTFEGTLPIIEKNRAEALEKAIFKVVPGITNTKTFQLNEDESFTALNGEEAQGPVVYAGYDEAGNLVGVAIEASGQGYADIIRILYGYDLSKEAVVGFYVLESKETPGLGDKIEKDPNFLANFESLDVSLTDDGTALKNEVVAVKSGTKEHPWEVDCITGATISSRAIGDMIGVSTRRWVPLIYQNKETFVIESSEKAQ